MNSSIIKLLLAFFMMTTIVHGIEESQDSINVYNKALKDWGQDDLDAALINPAALQKLLESSEVVEFSDKKFKLESLNGKLGIQAVIGMNGNNVSFIIPLTKGLKEAEKLEIGNKKDITSLIVPEGLSGLKKVIIRNNEILQSVVLPNGMTNLKKLKFNGNNLLESVDFPADMNSLKTLTLMCNYSLQSIMFPTRMVNLTNISLNNNNSLQLAKLPPDMTSLQSLDLRSTPITIGNIVQLRNQYPEVVLSDFDSFFNGHINQQVNVQSQEAIVQQREIVTNAYIKFATGADTEKLVAANLPTIENIKEKFFYSSDDMKELLGQALASNVEFKLTEGQKFRLENAFRSLRLLQSDENIERHAVSNLDSYGSYAYHGLPNIR